MTRLPTWVLALVWIYYERGSRHPLTAVVHKRSYKSEETLSLWPCQTYGSSCSCPPSTTSLSHDMTGLRTVWHPEETTKPSAKILGGGGHHEHRALSCWCLECCDRSVSMEGATTRKRSSIEIERVHPLTKMAGATPTSAEDSSTPAPAWEPWTMASGKHPSLFLPNSAYTTSTSSQFCFMVMTHGWWLSELGDVSMLLTNCVCDTFSAYPIQPTSQIWQSVRERNRAESPVPS